MEMDSAQLGRLDTALGIAGEADSESKWKQLGELAMSSGKLDVRCSLPPVFLDHRSALHIRLFASGVMTQ